VPWAIEGRVVSADNGRCASKIPLEIESVTVGRGGCGFIVSSGSFSGSAGCASGCATSAFSGGFPAA